MLIKALKISFPAFKLKLLSRYTLTSIHFEILLAISECLIKMDLTNESQKILYYLDEYLDEAHISYIENIIYREKLMYQLSSLYIKLEKYKEVLSLTSKGIELCIDSSIYFTIYELTYNYIIGCYKQGNYDNAITLFRLYYCSVASAGLPFLKQHKNNILHELLKEMDDKTIHYNFEKTNNIVYHSYISDTDINNLKSVYDLCDIIKDARNKNHIQQHQLAFGICSVSTISKIENKITFVDYHLADIILQRLGIYLKNVNIYVSDTDYEIIKLKNHLLFSIIVKNENAINQLKNSYYKKINKENKINMQIIYLANAVIAKDNNLKLKCLEKALQCTLPEFQLINIKSYCLSIHELIILNHIARTYYLLGKKLYAIHYGLTLINFLNDSPYQLLEKQLLLNMIIKNLTDWFYDYKDIGVIKELNEYVTVNYNPDTTTSFYNFINALKYLSNKI